jgi:hypothetical protein
MFKRIKNLLDISRYTVEELKTTPLTTTENKPPTFKQPKRPQLSSTPHNQYARIVEIKSSSPLDEFTHDSAQQPFDDTAT